MNHIQWYPGHIAKAEKQLKEKLNLVDVIVEVVDARIPVSSSYPNADKLLGQKPRLILLNKADLADEVSVCVKYLQERNQEMPVLQTTANSNKDYSIIINTLMKLGEPAIKKLTDKGLLPRPIRVMVVGMPNVGKSSIINKLIKKQKAKVGAKAGVTRQQQWVRINPKIDLLDTPGIIPVKQENQDVACKLAIVNAIGENAYDNEYVADYFLKNIKNEYKARLKEHYKISEEELSLETVALARNWIVSNGVADVNRCATFILNDFRTGRLGKMTLDELN